MEIAYIGPRMIAGHSKKPFLCLLGSEPTYIQEVVVQNDTRLDQLTPYPGRARVESAARQGDVPSTAWNEFTATVDLVSFCVVKHPYHHFSFGVQPLVVLEFAERVPVFVRTKCNARNHYQCIRKRLPCSCSSSLLGAIHDACESFPSFLSAS